MCGWLQDHDSGKQRQLGKLSFVGHSLGESSGHTDILVESFEAMLVYREAILKTFCCVHLEPWVTLLLSVCTLTCL